MCYAALLFAAQLVWPSQLRLDGQGLAFRYLFWTRRRRWRDIALIDVEQIMSARTVKLVGRPGVVRDLALNGAWSLSSDQLASVLEGYLARSGGSPA